MSEAGAEQSQAQQDRDAAQALLAKSRLALENGSYRAAVELADQAVALVKPLTAFHGEIQLWRVTAYQAFGDGGKAIEICADLRRHPDRDTRKQAEQLQYILEAPRLATPEEWKVKIPDLTTLEGEEKATQWSRGGKSQAKEPEPEPWIPEPPDPEKVNLQDEPFVWVAIGVAVVVFAGLVWLA